MGWADAKAGALDAGIARLRNGLDMRHGMQAALWVPVYLAGTAVVVYARPVTRRWTVALIAFVVPLVETELGQLRRDLFVAVGALFAHRTMVCLG